MYVLSIVILVYVWSSIKKFCSGRKSLLNKFFYNKIIYLIVDIVVFKLFISIVDFLIFKMFY